MLIKEDDFRPYQYSKVILEHLNNNDAYIEKSPLVDQGFIGLKIYKIGTKDKSIIRTKIDIITAYKVDKQFLEKYEIAERKIMTYFLGEK